MVNKTIEDDFFNKVLDGIRKASKRMAEKSAANNEDLIVADKDGNPTSIPAKELLKSL
jgi:hypothetical protein